MEIYIVKYVFAFLYYSSHPLTMGDMFQDPQWIPVLEPWIVRKPIYTMFLPIHNYGKD